MRKPHAKTPFKTFIAALLALTACLLIAACAPSEQPDVSSSIVEEAPESEDMRLNDLMVDGSALTARTREALSTADVSYCSNVEAEFQLPELPSGCEVTSLTIALRAMGFNLTKTEIADNHLVIDGSEWGFTASPYEENGCGFPPGIVSAANSYLSSRGVVATAHDLTGSPFTSIAALVEAGYPVLIWTTLRYEEPNYDPARGGTDVFYINEHCVVLYDIEGTTVHVSNPLNGLETVETSQFAQVYEQCGRMAAVVFDFAV